MSSTLLALLAQPAISAAATRQGDRVRRPVQAEAHVPGEILVQFAERTSPLRRDAVVQRARGRVIESLDPPGRTAAPARGLLRVSTTLPLDAALAELRRDPDVLFAEPNWVCRAEHVSDDTYYASGAQWGAFGDDSPVATGPGPTTNAHGSQAEKAWALGHVGSRSVYVGILDEGIQIDHPDLAANIWTNPFDPPDGIDNDGNGYVDDVHGWDFYSGDASVYDGEGDDHGTHVAGTIGAVGGNATGVAGICWDVTLVPLKFLGPDNGRISDAVKALDYLVDLKVRHGLNVVAANHSWSTGGYSHALHDAILRAAKVGILSIAAAGNSGEDNDSATVYPANFDTTVGTLTQSAASYDAVISVAAIDRYGALATFSDYGATRVDLGAPGVSIASTLPVSRYGSYSGTSMAAPHVTGAAALYAAARPGASAHEIRQALLGAALPTPSLAGKTATGGRLNMGTGFLVDRDVAVKSLHVPALLFPGMSVRVVVTAANLGDIEETFSVSLTDAPPSGGTAGSTDLPVTLTLQPGEERDIAFNWSLEGASAGEHVLRASASRLNGESNVADNDASRAVHVSHPLRVPESHPAFAGAPVSRRMTHSSEAPGVDGRRIRVGSPGI